MLYFVGFYHVNARQKLTASVNELRYDGPNTMDWVGRGRLKKQVAQLSKRDPAAGWLSYDQRWKTGTVESPLRAFQWAQDEHRTLSLSLSINLR